MSNDIRADVEERKKFMDADPDGPFVMVNFLKFKPRGGSREYGKYGSAFSKLIQEYGGRYIYNGRMAHKFVGDDDWHAVALVEYPTRRAFYDLTTSDAYMQIHPHREDGLEKTLVYATTPLDRAVLGLD